ncbi:hypothetical protein DFH06DRAFT_1363712 [Mycena polygramma]|nr:hypothetical protein DFH06DRAFT_1363712 [Mycena polygramma]
MLAPFRDAPVRCLEYLEFRVATGCAKRIRPAGMFLSGAHSLTFLKLENCTPYFPAPDWMMSLTHLELWYCDLDVIDDDGATKIYPQKHFTSQLKTLHLLISPDECSADCLLGIVAIFDTPALTDLTINLAHGDHISVLFDPSSVPHSVFPAVTSLSFVATVYRTIPTPALRLFPALSSLTLINECFMANIVRDLLGPGSQPWPLLASVTLCPEEDRKEEEAARDVYSAIQAVVRSKRAQGQPVPKFKVSRLLFHQDYWAENELEVELFDPFDTLSALG